MENLKKYKVKANSLDDFLKRYSSRAVIARGEEHHQARLKSHNEDLQKYGFTFITHHDSITGEIVAYFENN